MIDREDRQMKIKTQTYHLTAYLTAAIWTKITKKYSPVGS